MASFVSPLDPSTGTSQQNITVNLIGSYGACLVAIMISIAIWGTNIMQALIYLLTHPATDRWQTKAIIPLLMMCDSIRMVLILNGLFRPLVINWGDLSTLPIIKKQFEYQNIFFSCVVIISQSFFINRIYKLANGKKWILPPAIVVLVFELAAEIGFVSRVRNYTHYIQVFEDTTARGIIWAVTAVILGVDIFVAATLCIFLLKNNPRISQNTNSMVIRLISFTICTGLLTALVEMSIMVAIVVAQDSLIYLALQFLISPLYVSSVLGTLNARPWIRYGRTNLSRQWHSGSHSLGLRSEGPPSGDNKPIPLQVQVDASMRTDLEEFMAPPAPLKDGTAPMSNVKYGSHTDSV